MLFYSDLIINVLFNFIICGGPCEIDKNQKAKANLKATRMSSKFVTLAHLLLVEQRRQLRRVDLQAKSIHKYIGVC